MNMIRYVDSLESITAQNLHGFFVGWPNPPTPQTHLELLRNSGEIVLAVDDEAHRVVGFITALTDRTLSAYIPLLEVLPAYQGRGVGRELVRRMMEKLSGLYMIDLLCDEGLRPFYAGFGMRAGHGMMRRDYGRQSGRK
jgi:ribosomal protein S18 acetylase RimI-like enzyme